MTKLTPLLIVPGLVALAAPSAEAQVLRELDPIELKYAVTIRGEDGPAGTYETRFEVVDTARGRRLRVTATLLYALGIEQDDSVQFRREETVFCDGEGIEKFEASTSHGDRVESVTAFRRGIDYHLTVKRGEETKQRTETAGVQRSPLGFFAAAFQKVPMPEAELAEDYPLLSPARGRHSPRQRFLVGKFPSRTASGEKIQVAETHLRRVDKGRDDLWHRVDHPHQPLLRMVEHVFHGVLEYELIEVNGAPVDWASAAHSRTP